LVAPGDMFAEESLGFGYNMLCKGAVAVEHADRYIALAEQEGTNSEHVRMFRKIVEFWKPRFTPAFFTNSPPQEYTEAELSRVLRKKLTHEQLLLVTNSLAHTVEMDRWARELTRGATNDLQKAKALFNEISEHASYDGDPPAKYMTAQEVFARWHELHNGLYCQQGAVLLIALARATGLKAYMVDVDEACDGNWSPHGCAAIYINGRLLLADPSYYWFGAPHRRFRIFDDVEAAGDYLAGLPDVSLTGLEAASKLAPKSLLVQYDRCCMLMSLNRWQEAHELLPMVKKLSPDSPTASQLEALFAMRDGRSSEAVVLLRKASEMSPSDSTVFYQLGNAYTLDGKTNQAREAYLQALKLPRSRQKEQSIREGLSRLERVDH